MVELIVRGAERIASKMTDRELILLITEYVYLKRKFERVTSKLKEELEERERNEQIQFRAKKK